VAEDEADGASDEGSTRLRKRAGTLTRAASNAVAGGAARRSLLARGGTVTWNPFRVVTAAGVRGLPPASSAS